MSALLPARFLLHALATLALAAGTVPVARAAGQLDPLFGDDGRRAIGFDVVSDFDDRATAMAALDDGRLVLVGQVRTEGDDWSVGVTRLRGDGGIDASFGSAGRLVVRDAAGHSLQPYAVGVQSDGRIVVTGARYASFPLSKAGTPLGLPGIVEWFVLRIHANGSGVDTSFGAGGMALVDVAGDARQGRAIAIQADDRIVVAGSRSSAVIPDSRMVAARLTADGGVDASFGGGDGVFSEDFAATHANAAAHAVLIQTDGKIVLAGRARKLGGDADYDMALVRLDNTGQPDAAFGLMPEPGRTVVDFSVAGTPRHDEAFSLAFRGPFLDAAARRLVVAGASREGTDPRLPAIAMLDYAGQLDNGFSADGRIRFGVAFESIATGINALGLEKLGTTPQTADRILLGGTLRDAVGNACFAARLDFSGILDPQFANGTLHVFRMSAASIGDDCRAGLARDGRFFLAGATTPEMSPGGVDFAAFALLADHFVFRDGFE